MKKYIVELIGTFFLVLTVACTAVLGDGGALTPLAIGSALMVMIYAGGHISGGHYNPAVTIGVFLRGRCDFKDVIPYWVAQFAGAALAVITAKALYPDAAKAIVAAKEAAAAAPAVVCQAPAALPIILAEFLFTFALVYVVLNVATAKRNAGTGFYGLAIGFTVLVGAVAVGGISGGAFNPAVALGVSLIGKPGVILSFSTIWMHLVGEILAAVVAGVLFKALNTDDK